MNSAVKNRALKTMARCLRENTAAILKANALDIKKAKKDRLAPALMDRLSLTAGRIKDMAVSLQDLAGLADPNNQILAKIKRPNGLDIEKISVPMGVIAVIYEARPNVTADAAGLCFKAGSAVILRGGSDAARSNKAIAAVLRESLRAERLPADIIQLVETAGRQTAAELMTLRQYIDLLVPRGGAGLIRRTVEESLVPVIETGTGNCHVYVDKYADLKKALAITINAKTQRPSVCNAAESLLVHKDAASRFLPAALPALRNAGVAIHGCAATRKYASYVLKASAEDYAREYLALEISIKVVKSIDEAIEHIHRYGTRHTEAIVTENRRNARRFLSEVDASAVLVNASTRFTDGGEFGFGCEIGISTQKLHARGPLGLKELMSYKYLVRGNGQIRQ